MQIRSVDGVILLQLKSGENSTAVKWVRMLKPPACDRARVGMGCTISIETQDVS